MKKSITTTFSLLGSFFTQAQTSTLLFEDFERGIINDKLISTNDLSVFTNEMNEKKGSLYYNSSDTTAVSLKYSLSGNNNANDADSVTVCYINDFNSSRSNREKGNITIVRDTISYQDSTLVSVGIENTKLPFGLYLNAKETVSKAVYFNNTGSVKACKTFKKPLSSNNEIDIINFKFSKIYTLDGKSDENPKILIRQVCTDRFKDLPSAVGVCIQSLSTSIPVMVARQLLIDNVEIKLHTPIVTSTDNLGFSETHKKAVKAFNIKGQEISIDTFNEVIILKYEDGTAVKTFKPAF